MNLVRAVKHRRNFLPAFLLTLLLWLGWVLFFVSFAPTNNLLIFTFYLLFFCANFLAFSLILGNSRRGFLIGVAFTIVLFLKQIGQAHVLNFVLLLGIILSIELYLRTRY
jgi:hypothetical protein